MIDPFRSLQDKTVAPVCTLCNTRKKWSKVLQLWVCPNGARCLNQQTTKEAS